MKAGQLKSIAVVYHYFAHYRRPILEEMSRWSESGGPSITFLASPLSNDFSIKTVGNDFWDVCRSNAHCEFVPLRNLWLSQNVLWQIGLLSYVFRCREDCLVFLGSPYFLSTWLAAGLARVRRKKVVFWTHGVTHHEPLFPRLLRGLFYRLPHRLMLYGNRARRQLMKEYGLGGDKLQVIFNSLDYVKQVRHREGLTEDTRRLVRERLFPGSASDPLILGLGRLTRVKEYSLLVDAVSGLSEQGLKANLLFVGDGEERKHLENRIQELGLSDRTCFYGDCYDERELAGLIASSDVCVVPGALGLTAMHSLVYGTPVVGNDDPEGQMPEVEAVVPGFNGFLFEKGDIDSLTCAIKTVVESDDSPDTIRRNCHYVIDNFYNPKRQLELMVNAMEGNEAIAVQVGPPDKP